MKLQMPYLVFFKETKMKQLQAENTMILHRLQFFFTNASLSGLRLSFKAKFLPLY